MNRICLGATGRMGAMGCMSGMSGMSDMSCMGGLAVMRCGGRGVMRVMRGINVSQLMAPDYSQPIRLNRKIPPTIAATSETITAG